MYFMISNMDGDTLVSVMTKAELEQRLEDETVKDFWDKIPALDTNLWECRPVIIKGEVVVPKPVEVATKFEVP